jgi:hypothetical protein
MSLGVFLEHYGTPPQKDDAWFDAEGSVGFQMPDDRTKEVFALNPQALIRYTAKDAARRTQRLTSWTVPDGHYATQRPYMPPDIKADLKQIVSEYYLRNRDAERLAKADGYNHGMYTLLIVIALGVGLFLYAAA